MERHSRMCSPPLGTRYSGYHTVRQLATLAGGYACWPSPRTSKPHKTSPRWYAQRMERHSRACAKAAHVRPLRGRIADDTLSEGSRWSPSVMLVA